MASCRVCSNVILKDEIACDGICGGFFHTTCLRRSSKTFGSVFTCPECSDIKPCHVLKFLKGFDVHFATLSEAHTFTAEKVNAMHSKWAGLEEFSDGLGALNDKLDKLLDIANALSLSSGSLLEKSFDLHSKLAIVSSSVDELHFSFSANGASSSIAPVTPVFDDIKRSLKRVELDLNSWTSTVTENSKLVSSLASDVKKLSPPINCGVVGASASMAPRDQRSLRNTGKPKRPKRNNSINRVQHSPPADPASVSDSSSVLPIDNDLPLLNPGTLSAVHCLSEPVSPSSELNTTLPNNANSQNSQNSQNLPAVTRRSVPPEQHLAPLTIVPTLSTPVPPQEQSRGPLITVPRPQSIFISRFSPTTSPDNILDYLSLKGIDINDISIS